LSLEQIAISLQTTAPIVERTIKQFALLKNEIAAKVMSQLRQPKAKGKGF
jgi:hypothetical protein